jgi:hypothetical protein
MSKTTTSSSSPVFIRQKIPTTAKQNRLRRIGKRSGNVGHYAFKMAKSECKNQKRLTTTGISCAHMKVAAAITLYLNNTSAHKQFFARKTLEPFK